MLLIILQWSRCIPPLSTYQGGCPYVGLQIHEGRGRGSKYTSTHKRKHSDKVALGVPKADMMFLRKQEMRQE
jgi:hypothetical protein